MNSVSFKTRVIWSKMKFPANFLHNPLPKIPFLGHRSQRRFPASVVRRPLDYLHFRLLLQNRLMDFDETWHRWSTEGPLQVLLFFGQIRPGADPGRGKNRSRGVPLLQETSSSDRKATATNRMHSSDLETCGRKCCYFWFHSVNFFTRFWRLFGLSQIFII